MVERGTERESVGHGERGLNRVGESETHWESMKQIRRAAVTYKCILERSSMNAATLRLL